MYRSLKRGIDATLSLFGIVILSPLLIFICVWIKADSKGPILFKQRRIGIHKTEFVIYKFRTMQTTTPQNIPTHLLRDANSYITRSGSFLRKTSLDELPQLFNILIGDMSVVGPRPALWNQYDLINERDFYHANDALPGLTGLAQINGRDELPISVKAKYDGEYLRKMSFMFDIGILVRTFFKVLRSEGVKEGRDENEANSHNRNA
jgi:O-antigen biosynthesis protein WbqP